MLRVNGKFKIILWLALVLSAPSFACSVLERLTDSTMDSTTSEVRDLARTRESVANKFGEILGEFSGGQAWVFRVKKPNGEEVSIKVAKTRAGEETLTHEVAARERSRRGDSATIEQIHKDGDLQMLEAKWATTSLDRSLEDYYGKNASTERILEGMEHLLDTLTYFHESGGVHRDIKPENILMEIRDNPNGETDVNLIITDYGLASLDGNLPKSVGKVSGTVRYMSEAQAKGNTPTPSDDLASLKKTLVEMVLGKRLNDIPNDFVNQRSVGGIPTFELGAPLEMIGQRMGIKVEPTLAMLVEYPAKTAQEWRQVLGMAFHVYSNHGSEGVLEMAGKHWVVSLAHEDPAKAYRLLASSEALMEEFRTGKFIPTDSPMHKAIIEAASNPTKERRIDFFTTTNETKLSDD